MEQMNRRKFVKIAGSLAVGGVVLSVVGNGLWKMFTHPEKLFNDSKRSKGFDLLKEDGDFVSPYRRTFAFELPDEVEAFDVKDGSIYVASSNNIYVYGMSGEMQTSFPVPSAIRNMAIFDDKLYVLFSSRVEVYDRNGNMLQHWDACSDNSDYFDLAVCKEGVFVTDVANKNICKYNLDGTLSRFITSPKGFIVPSYCFSIMAMEDRIYCSNPGRHIIEEYTMDGELVSSFGKAGAGEGAFSGCCNPAVITPANNGEILTSEKGIPRVSCYSKTGKFRSVLLDSKALGGGHEAYKVRIMKDKLIVAKGKKMSVFQFNKNVSRQTACGQCEEECPLKAR